MTTDDVNYILENQKTIEEKISYQFRYHTKLLVQAFTRKSFSQEHDGYEDNEILELYGDQLVNTVMTKWLYDSYSTVPQTYTDDFFYSKKNEAELSKIRANYVNKSALAHCIDMLDLDDYLLLGNSDEKNEVWRNEKVRCDLFEAIIGIAALVLGVLALPSVNVIDKRLTIFGIILILYSIFLALASLFQFLGKSASQKKSDAIDAKVEETKSDDTLEA